MTKAEMRKMTKLEHMVVKADEHKRVEMRKKIEVMQAKIKTMQAQVEEMQAKIKVMTAKGQVMVDDYNYFVGHTMQEHKEDLQALRDKQAAEAAELDVLSAAKTANMDRAAVKDVIAPETHENGLKDDVKAVRDTNPVTDAKTQITAQKEANAGISAPEPKQTVTTAASDPKPEPSKNGQNNAEKTGRDTQTHDDPKKQITAKKQPENGNNEPDGNDTDDRTVSAQDWAWMARQFGITPEPDEVKEESSKEECTVNNPFFGNYA